MDGEPGGEVERKAKKHKGKHDKPKPWDEDPNIDHCRVEKFDPSCNDGGMPEVNSFSTLFPQYQEKYLQQVRPNVKSALKDHGISCELNLMADEKNKLAKILLAQAILDNPFMKLLRLHHLVAAQVVIIIIAWIARRKNQRKRISHDDINKLSIAVESVANAIIQSTNAMIQASNTMMETITNILNPNPTKDCDVWAMLSELGISQPFLSKAYMFLFEDPKMLEGMIRCPNEHRKSLLLTLMGYDHEPQN